MGAGGGIGAGEALRQRLRESQSLLALREAPSEAAYLEALTQELWVNHAVETGRFRAAQSGGRWGGLKMRLRRVLWSLLRYQHDWVTFQQNAVNLALAAQVRAALDEQQAQSRRLECLETADATGESGQQSGDTAGSGGAI